MEWENEELKCIDKEIEILFEELRALWDNKNRDAYELSEKMFDLRRKTKRGGRVFILETEIKDILNEEFSTETTFEDRISDKMLYKSITREEAIQDIIKNASKENKDIPTHLILSNPATYIKIK